jgi:hypothetical protein
MDYQRLHDTWTGQDGRYPPRAVLDWGLNDPRLQFVPYWRNTAVASGDKELLVSLWRLPDRVLMVVFNNNSKQSKDAALRIDLRALGLGAGVPVARELGECGDPDVQFDAANSALRIPGLQPHTARYVGVRVHQPAVAERLRKTLDVVGLRITGIPEELFDWGWVSADTRLLAPVLAPAVRADKDMHLALWQMPDRVLLAVSDVHAKSTRDATISIDLDALQLAPKLPWQEFVRVRTFKAGVPETTLDFHSRKLLVPKLQPGELRLIGVRRY